MKITKKDLVQIGEDILSFLNKANFDHLMKEWGVSFQPIFYKEKGGKVYIYTKCGKCGKEIEVRELTSDFSVELCDIIDRMGHEKVVEVIQKEGILKECECGEKIVAADTKRTTKIFLQKLQKNYDVCYFGNYKNTNFIVVPDTLEKYVHVDFGKKIVFDAFTGYKSENFFVFWENGDVDQIYYEEKNTRKWYYIDLSNGTVTTENRLSNESIEKAKKHIGEKNVGIMLEAIQTEKPIRFISRGLDFKGMTFDKIQDFVDHITKERHLSTLDIIQEIQLNDTKSFNMMKDGPFLGESYKYAYHEEVNINGDAHFFRYNHVKEMLEIRENTEEGRYQMFSCPGIPLKLYAEGTILENFSETEIKKVLGIKRPVWRRVYSFLRLPVGRALKEMSHEDQYYYFKLYGELIRYRCKAENGTDDLKTLEAKIREVNKSDVDGIISAEDAAKIIQFLYDNRMEMEPEYYFILNPQSQKKFLSIKPKKAKLFFGWIKEELMIRGNLVFGLNRMIGQIKRICEKVDIEDFIDYLLDLLRVQGFKSLNDAINSWYDFIDFSEKAGLPLDGEKMFPKTLILSHDIANATWSSVKNEEIVKRFNKKIEEQKKHNYSDKKYSIRAPLSVDDLKNEGVILQHCVGGYVDRIANGESEVYFLRKNSNPEKSYITVELCNGEISQANGYKNRSYLYNKEIRSFLSEWMETFNG